MNIRKTLAGIGLAAVALSFYTAAPVQAQGFHPFHNGRMRHAARLDRKAAHAAYNGNYRKAAKLRSRANHLRHKRYGL